MSIRTRPSGHRLATNTSKLDVRRFLPISVVTFRVGFESHQWKQTTFNLVLNWLSKELYGALTAVAGTWPLEFRKPLASLYFSLKPQ